MKSPKHCRFAFSGTQLFHQCETHFFCIFPYFYSFQLVSFFLQANHCLLPFLLIVLFHPLFFDLFSLPHLINCFLSLAISCLQGKKQDLWDKHCCFYDQVTQNSNYLQSWYSFRLLPLFTSYGKKKAKSPANLKGINTSAWNFFVHIIFYWNQATYQSKHSSFSCLKMFSSSVWVEQSS